MNSEEGDIHTQDHHAISSEGKSSSKALSKRKTNIVLNRSGNEHWNPWLLGSSLVARTSKLGQTNKPKKEPKSEILEEKPGKIQ